MAADWKSLHIEKCEIKEVYSSTTGLFGCLETKYEQFPETEEGMLLEERWSLRTIIAHQ
jgi:hypothetical protein